jgi:formate dehydrogenase assembly factor FdhD
MMTRRTASFQNHASQRWRLERRSAETVLRDLPAEVPSGLEYDSRPYVLVLATPTDVEDRATGLGILVSISAPITVAITRVKHTAITLVALARSACRTELAVARRTAGA